MPSILFLHENYPAQFGALAGHLASLGWNVVFATQREGLATGTPKRLKNGVHLVRYARARDAGSSVHRYLQGTEKAVLNGQGFARLGHALAKGGFTPDIIVAHSGWGSGSFAKVVWPNARFVQYLEWWYNYPAADYDPSQYPNRTPENEFARTLVRNLPFMLDFQQADLVIAPTQFQADQAPGFIQDKLVVQHDGVDFDAFRPLRGGEAHLTLPGVPDQAPVVTFATRGMEPARGFPDFIAAAAIVQKQHPNAHIVVAGQDGAFYGPKPTDYPNWKAKALAENDLDPARLHFTGLLPKPDYARLLRRSNAHAYLTQPFVLSWSMIEAMASGAPIIATDVAPVREVIGAAGQGAQLVAPGSVKKIASQMLNCLEDQAAALHMGRAGRKHARRQFEVARCHAALTRILCDQLPQQVARSAA